MNNKQTYQELETEVNKLREEFIAKKILEKENSLLKTIFNECDLILFSLDKNYCYLSFNENHFQTIKKIWNVEIAIGMNMLEMISLQADREKAKIDFDIALAGESITRIDEYGDEKFSRSYYEDSYSPLKDSNGNIYGLFGSVKEITKLKITEETLIESEKNYKKLIEIMPDGVYKSTHDGEFVEINPAMVKILGYNSKEELLAADIKNDLYIEDSDRDSIILDELNKELGIYQLRKKDGSLIWVEDHGWYSFDESGEITYHEGIMRDVTERIQREQELIKAKEKAEESDIKITSLINNLPGLIYRSKSDWSAIFIKNTKNITGYSEADFTTNKINWTDLILPDDKEEVFKNSLELSTKRKNIVQQYRILTKENVVKHIVDHKSSLFSKKGEFLGIDGVVFDITKNKLLEKREISRTRVMEKITKGEELSTVLEFIVHEVEKETPDRFCSILILSDDGEKLLHGAAPSLPVFYNNAINGIEIGENVGSCGAAAFTKKRVIVEDIQTHPNWMKLFKDLAKQANLAACWSQPIIGSLGKVLGTFAIYHKEISKPTEEDIYRIEFLSNMTGIAIERSRAHHNLIKEKERAEESDRLKSAFLANMSHEIRTPMNGILGFINLLNQPNLNKTQIDKYSKIINKSGNRLLTTINDIIDISKIEAGEIIVSNTENSINNEMDELYSFFSPEAKRKGLSLSLSIEPSLSTKQITLVTDNHKLHGILTNLIKNAVKFTETGSITFGYSLKNNFIEFFVEDTGIGIPKDRLQAIFNRFEQADIEDVKVLEGSGLGLAISKAYVAMLGGEISVESVEGKGSKFVFTIPYVQKVIKEIEQLPESINNNTARIENLNLLVVEDDEVSSELLKVMLEGTFQKIILAKNGLEAIQLCKNSINFDLVLMDLKMPVMDGYTATKQIRKFNKDLVIIAQTAYSLIGDKEKAIEAGCNDYISKPIDKELMMEIISKHMVKKSI